MDIRLVSSRDRSQVGRQYVWFSLQHHDILDNKENPECKRVLRRKISEKSAATSIRFQRTHRLCINTTTTKVVQTNTYFQFHEVNSFIYLGATVHEESRSNKDITHRLPITKRAQASLSPLWKSRMYSKFTKLRILKSCVTSVPLYGTDMQRITSPGIE